ncbi:MAG TPA: CDP-alcohol phosphatidyltransferase family protein [Chthoniobacterales bacterium]|nr:CDP-alcohol phosphatidyltransferase family protein [Chthoniobacterales bacterium]
MNVRRVLILADESADWMVAGLRQLDRLALAIDEFAVLPVSVCIFWKPNLDQSQRWIPSNPRLTKLAFNTDLDGQPYDLVLTTRLFLYRKAMVQLVGQTVSLPQPASWENYFTATKLPEPSGAGAWEQIANGDQIDGIERRFLRGSGKSQDGLVSRYLNRPISRAMTRLLLRFPVTPNGWTWGIFPIPIIAALVLADGNYWSFVWGLILFQVFSVLDGCDGEIARAKFMESERGRQLDDFFDVLSNILLVVGLGFGLSRAHPRFGWLFVAEGIAAAGLIALNEWQLGRQKPAPVVELKDDSLGGALYPRHRVLVARSGLLVFGEKFAALLIQLTKRDVAVLFFVFVAVIGLPSLILHLLFAVATVSLVLAVKARSVL